MPILDFLQAREDFKASKEDVMREAIENGTNSGITKWWTQASEMHMHWKKKGGILGQVEAIRYTMVFMAIDLIGHRDP